jgi:twinkle protein
VGDEKMKVSDYLHAKGIQFKRRGDEAISNCPFCDPPDTEKKFSINLATGAFNCLHLSRCGVKGSFYEFQKKFGDIPERLNESRFINLEKSYKKPKVVIKKPVDKVKEYLKGRGFTDETIEYFGFGLHDNDTVMIPFYRNNELILVKYRSITDKKKMWIEPGGEPILFNRDRIEKEALVITEGEYDCAALYQYGIESVSVPMGAGNFQWVENEWDYIDTFNSIYICFDNDGPGIESAKKLAVKVGEWRCHLVTLPKKDANECLKSGVPLEDMIRCFANAKDIKPDSLVMPGHFRDRIQGLFRKGQGLFGVPTPWDKLNALLKGWRDGEVTVWSGMNGSGKSTILNQVIIGLAKKKVKCCVYSGEMPPERYLRWAIIQYLENDSPAPERIDETLEWMNEKIYILNITAIIEPDKLISDFEYAAQRYNVKQFFIDSLMKVMFKETDEYRQQQLFMSRLCNFAQKFDAHIHLVAHPRKPASDDDETGKVDVKGSSDITNLCSNVITLQRLTESKKEAIQKKGKTPADMKLFLRKNREFGIEGIINMSFDVKTKIFSDGG